MYRNVFSITLLGILPFFTDAQSLTIHDGELKGLVPGASSGGTTSTEIKLTEGNICPVWIHGGFHQQRLYSFNADGSEGTVSKRLELEEFKRSHIQRYGTQHGEINILYKLEVHSRDNVDYDFYFYRPGTEPKLFEQKKGFSAANYQTMFSRYFFFPIEGDDENLLLLTKGPKSGGILTSTSTILEEFYLVNKKTLEVTKLGFEESSAKKGSAPQRLMGTESTQAWKHDGEILITYYATRGEEDGYHQEIFVYDMDTQEGLQRSFGTPEGARERAVRSVFRSINGELRYVGLLPPSDVKSKEGEYEVLSGVYTAPEGMFKNCKRSRVRLTFDHGIKEYSSILTVLPNNLNSGSSTLFHMGYYVKSQADRAVPILKLQGIGLLLIDEEGGTRWIERMEQKFTEGVPSEFTPLIFATHNKIHVLQNAKGDIIDNIIDLQGNITTKGLAEGYKLVPSPYLQVNDKEWKVMVHKGSSARLATFRRE